MRQLNPTKNKSVCKAIPAPSNGLLNNLCETCYIKRLLLTQYITPMHWCGFIYHIYKLNAIIIHFSVLSAHLAYCIYNTFHIYHIEIHFGVTWWRHRMETFSALLALCAGNSPVTGELPSQRPVTRSFDASFDLHMNKQSSKQSRGWWFETPSRPLWRHRNGDYKCFYLSVSIPLDGSTKKKQFPPP